MYPLICLFIAFSPSAHPIQMFLLSSSIELLTTHYAIAADRGIILHRQRLALTPLVCTQRIFLSD